MGRKRRGRRGLTRWLRQPPSPLRQCVCLIGHHKSLVFPERGELREAMDRRRAGPGELFLGVGLDEGCAPSRCRASSGGD
jgi:hypothetical protein